MDGEVAVNRQAIRSFIASHQAILEQAQADGTLARTKLDLRDMAETQFSDVQPDQHARFLSTFTEELDAFCSDMRLASVTVQQQVERHHPPSFLRIAGCAALGLVLGFFFGGLLSDGNGETILAGMLLGCVVGGVIGFNWRTKDSGQGASSPSS